jgi:OFA family oxalate/formate antiporter-like MFS transporter
VVGLGQEKRGGQTTGRIFYGWYILPVAIMGVIVSSPGQTFGIAAFNESFRTSLRLTHGELTGAYMLGTLLAALPLSFVGLMMDRHGIRRVTMVVVLLLGLACCLTALVNGLFMLFVAFFLLRMLGPGSLSLLSGSTLGFWFDKRLGAVEGVRSLGMALAFAVVPGVNLWLIDRVGWRWSFVILGAAVCALMLPLLATVFRDRPEDVGQRRDGVGEDEASSPGESRSGPEVTFAAALRSRAFWVMLFINGLWGMVATALTFNIVPLAQAQGLGANDAAGLLAIFAATLAVTHLIGGVLADRLPLRLLLASSAACMALSTHAIGSLTLPGMALTCGVAMGVAQGLSTGLTSVACVRFFGRLHLGRIRGVYSTSQIAASSVGPFVLGLCRDMTGDYRLALTAFTVLSAVACVAGFFATTLAVAHDGAVALGVTEEGEAMAPVSLAVEESPA